MLSFDHVSLVGREPAVAQAGLLLTPTRGDECHARVHFDGSYLELRATGPTGTLRGTGWFLRPSEPSTIAASLVSLGVPASDPTPHRSADGTWSDISVGDDAHGVAAPVITHRVDRPDWPPAAGDAHPSGAVAVAGLELATPNPAALGRLLTRLGAVAVIDDARGTATAAVPRSTAALLDLGELRLTLLIAARPALRALTLRGPDGPLRLSLTS